MAISEITKQLVSQQANQLKQRKGANDKQIAEYQAIIDSLEADNAVIPARLQRWRPIFPSQWTLSHNER